MSKEKFDLGQIVYGVDLHQKTAELGITSGRVEQKTIDKDGYIVVWIQVDENAYTYRQSRVFETKEVAEAFYQENRPLYIERDKLVDEVNAEIDKLMAPITPAPEFPELAEKQ